MLGRYVVTAKRVQTRCVLPHPLQGGPGFAEMDAFPGQYVAGGFRHANSSDAGSVGLRGEGPRYLLAEGKSMGFHL